MKLIKILFSSKLNINYFLYLSRSIFGCIFYKIVLTQPQLTKDYFISSNHFYTFLVISLYGFTLFYQNYKNFIIFYLLSLSIILETSHLIIPIGHFNFRYFW